MTLYHQSLLFNLLSSSLFIGGSRDRTDDPLLAKQMLSQLSYAPNSLTLHAFRGPGWT